MRLLSVTVLSLRAWLLGMSLLLTSATVGQAQLHTITVKNPEDLRAFFRYGPDRIPFISAHRGGARLRFPENCIATFENTLRHTHAILEVDPRLTKDSVIVLMHDATLDRTTNGTGRVADYTWAELQALRLRDTEGNVTDYRIPKLDEVIQWAKGKTILILDKKSVPPAMTAALIRAHQAEAWTMVMAYSYEEAQQYYEWNKDLMMEVFIPNRDRLAAFEKSGVPFENIVAFLAHRLPEDPSLYEAIHEKGVMCIVGSSRVYDGQYLAGQQGVYASMIEAGVDIIEADRAIEAGQAIQTFVPKASGKKRFFQKR